MFLSWPYLFTDGFVDIRPNKVLNKLLIWDTLKLMWLHCDTVLWDTWRPLNTMFIRFCTMCQRLNQPIVAWLIYIILIYIYIHFPFIWDYQWHSKPNPWKDILWNLGSGPQFNVKMSSYQYRKSHCGDKMVVRSSYLHNGISYTGKTTSLYWFSPQNADFSFSSCACHVVRYHPIHCLQSFKVLPALMSLGSQCENFMWYQSTVCLHSWLSSDTYRHQ